MVRGPNLGESFVQWISQVAEVSSLVLMGSQARDKGQVHAADAYSDWDFQLVTTNIEVFRNPSWTIHLNEGAPLAYALRPGRLGEAEKVTVIFERGELDLVLIPSRQLRVARFFVGIDAHLRSTLLQRKLANLSTVLNGGYRLIKGGKKWAVFFERVSSEVPCRIISDKEVIAIAEEFVCETVSTRRKIERGEYLAAQRWIHCLLGESNLSLLNELRRRQNKASVFDARRCELLLVPHEYESVRITALPDRASLSAALEKSITTLQSLTRSLVGDQWRWPALTKH